MEFSENFQQTVSSGEQFGDQGRHVLPLAAKNPTDRKPPCSIRLWIPLLIFPHPTHIADLGVAASANAKRKATGKEISDIMTFVSQGFEGRISSGKIMACGSGPMVREYHDDGMLDMFATPLISIPYPDFCGSHRRCDNRRITLTYRYLFFMNFLFAGQ